LVLKLQHFNHIESKQSALTSFIDVGLLNLMCKVVEDLRTG